MRVGWCTAEIGRMECLMDGGGCIFRTGVKLGAIMGSGKKDELRDQGPYFSGITTNLWEHCRKVKSGGMGPTTVTIK